MGALTEFLIARGWTRDDSPEVCGDISNDPEGTGDCAHVAYWSRPFHAQRLCAQHAARLERILYPQQVQ